MALAPLKVAALQQSQPITRDQQGNPATWFMRSLNDTFKNIVAAVNAVIQAQNDADAAKAAADTAQGTAEGAQSSADTAQSSADTAQATAASAAADAATAQTRADDAFDLASDAVPKNQVSAPTYSTYGGQTVSNPPTQAEMQTLDNAVVALSAAFASMNGKLQSAEVFS
jgi:hypothetical protein